MVLAAGGETLWHVNSAAAAQGSSRLRTPTAALVATHEASSAAESVSNATESKSNAAESNAAMLTTPTFKPFVLVRIQLPSGYSKGEVMGLNEAGQAVGWAWNSSAGIANAFFFDPANAADQDHGVVILDTDDQNMDAAWAYSLSDEDPPTIAGEVIWKANPDYQRAALWDGPDDEAYTPFASGVVSTAWDIKSVSTSTTLAGSYVSSGELRSVVYDGSLAYPASGVEGEAVALNHNGEVVGWHTVSGESHAYSWVPSSTTDIHPSGWDSSGATAINDDGDIGGWVVDDPNGRVPAFWYNTGSNFYSFTPFVSVGAQSEVCDLNSYGEMAVTNTTGTGGGAIWQVIDDEDVAYNFNAITLMPDATGHVASARAINDKMWVGGSYKATSSSEIQPCLIIPYDVDNNGVPDYRTIVSDPDTYDNNGNFLLDWAENIDTVGMRVGLHAPGTRSNNWSLIDYRQISRHQMHLRNLALTESENYDESYPLDLVVQGGEACEDFQDGIENWTRGTTQDPRQGELIIWIRSSLEESDMDFDYLPTDGGADELTDIHIFAHRFAKCIDYVQTGNEVFGGAGQYKIRSDDLSGWSWEGDPLTLGDILDDEENLGVDCMKDAVDAIYAWLKAQMWAALEGSALSGRPLRMIGPGIPGSFVKNGFSAQSEDHTGRYVTTHTSEWCNENQMYFDLHDHYLSYTDAVDPIEKLTDTSSAGSAPWDVPNWLACLEVGPKVDDESQWAANNADDYAAFIACGTPGYSDWADFVDSWQAAQWPTDPDFGLNDALAALASLDFAVACYGPTIQTQSHNGVFDLAAIRATFVCSGLIARTNKMTELKDIYEQESETYDIDTFQPHSSACDGCPQQ